MQVNFTKTKKALKQENDYFTFKKLMPMLFIAIITLVLLVVLIVRFLAGGDSASGEGIKELSFIVGSLFLLYLVLYVKSKLDMKNALKDVETVNYQLTFNESFVVVEYYIGNRKVSKKYLYSQITSFKATKNDFQVCFKKGLSMIIPYSDLNEQQIESLRRNFILTK